MRGGLYCAMLTGLFCLFFRPQTSAQHVISYGIFGRMTYYVVPDSVRIYYSIKDAVGVYSIDRDSAIKIIKKGIEESKRLQFNDGIFTGLFLLGVLSIYHGEYEIARDWLEQARLHAVRTSGVATNICRTLNNLGNTYHFQGDYKKAATYYFHAISIAEEVLQRKKQDRDSNVANPLVRIYISAASAILQLGESEKALYYLDKAESLAIRMDFVRNLASVYVGKALVYKKMGQMKKAWQYSRQALHLARRMKLEELEHMALHTQGDLLVMNNQPEKAIPCFKMALDIPGNINPYYKAGTLLSLGNAYLFKGEYAHAERSFRRAYKQADTLNIPELLLKVHEQMALLYERMGDFRRAYMHNRSAYALNDSLLNKEKTEAVSLLEVKYRTAEKEKDITQKQFLINEQQRTLGKKNMWIVSACVGIGMLAMILFVSSRNYHHKQKLHSEQLRTMKQETEIALLQAMMNGEEKQRVRFARELHDGISSQLSAVKLYIGTIRNETRDMKTGDDLKDVMHMLAEASDDVRKTAHNLIPDGLIRQGLADATRSFCEHLSHGEKLQIELQAYGDLGSLDSELELFVYRAVQELLHNIVKHADATHAIVLLNKREEVLSITVEDDGIGMNIHVPSSEGMGLRSLETRSHAVGGHFVLESVPGKGTTIYMEIPLKISVKALSDEYTHSHHG